MNELANLPNRSCRDWEQLAGSFLVQSPSLSGHGNRSEVFDQLQRHARSCSRCQREYGSLLGTDESLQLAYQALNGILRSPSPERSQNIWKAICEPSHTALLLKKTRRLTNTILWISVLVFSSSALLGLAWYVYWLLKVGKG